MSARRRILITGVTGLLGAAFVRESLENFEVFGLARRPDAATVEENLIPVDLRNEAAVAGAMETVRPDVVIHAGAIASVDHCESAPALAQAVNVQGTKNLLNALRGHPCRLIHISTDSVFDGTKGHYTEDDKPAPLHVYGRTKLEAEEAVLAERADALVVRTVFYGWNALPKRSLGEWVLDRLRAGETVPGFDNLRFSPLYAGQVARLLKRLISMPVSGVLHLGSINGCSKYEFACLVATTFGFPAGRVIRANWGKGSLAAARPCDVTLATTRATAVLERPLPSVAEGLGEFLAQEHLAERRAVGMGHQSEGARS